MTSISILERRHIEAEIIAPIYERLKEEFGIEKAQEIIGDAVKERAVDFGVGLRPTDQEPSINHFASLLSLWTRDNALEIEPIAHTEDRFELNVTRCRYCEMYKDMGLAEIGHLLSCNRDGSFCQGYDPRMKLTRTQTIMEGASHCDFRYRWEE